MIKLKSLLLEMLDSSNSITINDIEHKLDTAYSRSNKIHLDIILDWYYSSDPKQVSDMKDYLAVLNKVFTHSLEIIKNLNIPFVSIRELKNYLLSQEEFTYEFDSFFPMPLYVSSSSEDEATVGIMVSQNGKVMEIHEGNDEATPETTAIVNKLLHPSGKPVRIYGCHDTKLVFDIDETGYLPKNLFVSPKKEVASGYMDLKGERSLFTGIIDINNVAQDSDIDWKTLEKTKIEKFHWL